MFSLNPWDSHFINTVEFILKIIGGGGAFILFFIGFKRYKKDQTWKRSEFVAKEFNDFNSNKTVRNAMYMLDWGSRKIELFPDKLLYADRFAIVDRKILESALIYHELRIKVPNNDRFTEVEVAIRDTFDHFLSYFEKFDQFIIAKLITVEEIAPYLKYWVITITENMNESTREILYNFINEYGYTGTQDLFAQFKKSILPKIPSSSLVDSTKVMV